MQKDTEAKNQMRSGSFEEAQQAILQRLDSMTHALVALARTTDARLTRAEMCNRLGVSSNKLTARVRRGDVPTPGRDGKWLLARS